MFDTNVVLSALVFGRRLAWLRLAWARSTVVPVVCRETAAELIRVLAHPKFGLDPADQAALLGDYLPFAETARLPAPPLPIPTTCRDRADVVLIQLAMAARVSALISGDADVAGLHLPIPVMSAAGLHALLARDDQGDTG